MVLRLQEPPVQRVIEPILAGTLGAADATYDNDLSYVCDLGILARTGTEEIANPIYREVIARVLADPVQKKLTIQRASFVLPDGRLDLRKLPPRRPHPSTTNARSERQESARSRPQPQGA